MPRKVFVAGEILTAADVNTNLMDQAVMSFAGTAARGSAIPTPTEGMVTYLEDSDSLQVYTTGWGPISSVLQIVQTVKDDTFTTTSSSLTAVTGLSVSITPKSASSKVLVIAQVSGSGSTIFNGRSAIFSLYRGATNLSSPASSGSREKAFAVAQLSSVGGRDIPGQIISYLDSPATTSATTYQVYGAVGISGDGDTLMVNRGGIDTDSSDQARTVSTITAIEVAG